VVVACLATGGMVVSCSSADDTPDPIGTADAAPETSQVPGDASAPDTAPPRDAAPFDASPLPIVCTSPPCATSLVTTLGVDASDRAEGFCALLDDGTVACWGANRGAQLGRGDDAAMADNATPARVVGLSDIVALDHTCAIDKNGATWCWGTGPFLQSEWVATTTERTPVKLPIPPATHVGVGHSAACAVVADGVLCWGANTAGQIAPSDLAPWMAVLAPRAVALAGGAVTRDIVVSSASFVLREDGVVVSWGANPPLARVSPLFPDPYPQPVALGGISMMDVANDNACAVAGGIGYCWGFALPAKKGGELQLPTGPNMDRALPEPVVTPEPIVRISTTRTIITEDLGEPIVQLQRWCASSATGAVYCWGYNASGQAGDGTKDYAYQATLVAGLPAPAADVKTLPDATCALLTNGKVHCWGSGAYGQLGSGKLKVPSLVPQEVVLP
ncbi:MAG: hypothetical protein K0S65_1116, partial [Labilithrix sp.]|nr:hypothetical protein [Labilithrix sp.]